MQVEIKQEGNVVSIAGALRERDAENLAAEFSAKVDLAYASSANKSIRIDFSRLTRANSSGILLFLQTVIRPGHKVCYVNCPPFMTDMFNQIAEFFGPGVTVESIQVRYVAANGEMILRTMQVGRDIPIAGYQTYVLPQVEFGGLIYHADVNQEDDWSFFDLLQNAAS